MIDSTNRSGALRLIRCNVGDEVYALDISYVRSIQRPDRVRPNPTGSEPAGWVPSNEGDIPVFSLARQLGRKPGEWTITRRIIVLDAEPQPWAWRVDRISQVIQISREAVVPLPKTIFNPIANYFAGIVKMGEEMLLLLSPEHMRPDAIPTQEEAEFSGVETPFSQTQPQPQKQPVISQNQLRQGQLGIFAIGSTDHTASAQSGVSIGLSVSQIAEIVEPLPLIPVPAAPAYVLGFVNWRKQPVPIIDLAQRFALDSISTESQHRMVIIRGVADEPLVGFVTQTAIRIVRLPVNSQPCPIPDTLNEMLIRGAFTLRGETDETVLIPSIPGLLANGQLRPNS